MDHHYLHKSNDRSEFKNWRLFFHYRGSGRVPLGNGQVVSPKAGGQALAVQELRGGGRNGDDVVQENTRGVVVIPANLSMQHNISTGEIDQFPSGGIQGRREGCGRALTLW